MLRELLYHFFLCRLANLLSSSGKDRSDIGSAEFFYSRAERKPCKDYACAIVGLSLHLPSLGSNVSWILARGVLVS